MLYPAPAPPYYMEITIFMPIPGVAGWTALQGRPARRRAERPPQGKGAGMGRWPPESPSSPVIPNPAWRFGAQRRLGSRRIVQKSRPFPPPAVRVRAFTPLSQPLSSYFPPGTDVRASSSQAVSASDVKSTPGGALPGRACEQPTCG